MANESFANPANGHTYELLSPGAWSAEETEAESLGGHLATVRSAAENSWLATTFSSYTFWIGLNDSSGNGDFAWSSGNSSVYSNWASSPPTETAGVANAAVMPSGGTWQAEAETPITRYGVAEIGPTIPAKATLTSKQTVSGLNGTITSVTVNLDIASSNDSNLSASLISPGGVSVLLFSFPAGSGKNFTQTILDDSANLPITNVAAPFTGIFQPQKSLAAMAGGTPNGTWQLKIANDGTISTDTLNDWSLDVVTVPVDSDGDYDIPNGDQIPQTNNSTNFGSTSTSVEAQYTVINTGSGYQIGGTDVFPAGRYRRAGGPVASGTDASDFDVLPMLTLPLSNGQTSTFVVIFSPTAAGLRSAEITVDDIDGKGNNYSFGVEGTGVPDSEISVTTPKSTEIGSGETSQTFVFGISNTGLGPLLFSNPILSQGEYEPIGSTTESPDNASVAITNEPGTLSLSQGQSTTLVITFSPDRGAGT